MCSAYNPPSAEHSPMKKSARWAWVVATVVVTGVALVLAFVLTLNTTGRSFYERNFVWLFWLNSIVAIEQYKGAEMNPLVNAGAITTTSMVKGDTYDDVWRSILGYYGEFAGRALSVDLGKWPKTKAWLSRCWERPAAQKARAMRG